MSKKWETMELLAFNRHDWLNKIQLIKWNLELKNTEDAEGIIDEIIREAKNEAELSLLKMPKTAELLITSKWMGYPFTVDYEVLLIRKGCPQMDQCMYNWTVAFFDALSASVNLLWENELGIAVYESGEHIRFTFDLQGKIEDRDTVETFLQSGQGVSEVEIVTFTEEELVVEIELNGLI